MKRSVLFSIGLAAMSAGSASAALGPRNSKGWLGMDTLAPAPTLPTAGPASYLNLLVGTSASGVVTATPADDQVIDDANLCSWGSFNPYGASTRCDLRIHTNGILSRRGQNAAFFDNGVLPDTRLQMVLAPFWDDLAPVPAVSTITWEVEAGQYYIIRWNEFALYSDPAARLTFQVAFNIDGTFDAARWVLFQYIKMTGTGADGSSATIGIQYNNNGGNLSRHGPAFNEYATNVPGAIVTGDATGMPGTALQAILFDLDSDFDTLPRSLEARLGLNDTLADTDIGGVDDGAEYVNGTDPLNLADDVAADTDMDTLTNLDEAYYGTNPGLSDTDADGIDDPSELTAGTDPNDAGSFATTLLTTGGNEKFFPQAAVDAAGNVHAIAFDGTSDNTLYYYMFTRTGQPLIAETAFTPTFKASGARLRRAQIHIHAGKVYITYEAIDTGLNSSSIHLLRINPAADDRNGDAAVPATITELDVALPLGDRPRHHDAWVDASGVHLVWEEQPSVSPDGSGHDGPRGVRYGRVSLGGAFQAETTLMTIPVGLGGARWGIHKLFSPHLAVDSAGVAHVVWSAQSHPRSPQNDIYDQYPNGMFYAATDGSTTSGPYAIGPGRIERSDVALFQNRYLYISSSAGGSDGDDYYKRKGIRLGILDTRSFGAIPRVGDVFGVQWAIPSDTMLLPITTVLSGDLRTIGSAMHVLGNGAAVIYYNENRSSQFCLVTAGPDGTQIGQRQCFFGGQHHYHDRAPSFVQPMGAAFVGVVHGNRNTELRYDPIALSNWDTSGVTWPNSPPIITTSAPAGVTSVGTLYSYAAAATDPETASGNLAWSLVGAPAGMNVSAAGLVTFTPTLAQVGSYTPGLKVCDDDVAPRCTEQPLPVIVPQPSAPVITSLPATVAVAGSEYQYQVTATDADNDIASFSIGTPASPPGDMGLTPNGSGALLTWSPTEADVGSLAIVLNVVDDTGLQGTQSFSITVVPGPAVSPDGGADRPPAFTSIPATTALVGEAYRYEATAVDPDDATAEITYALTSDAPDDMALSQAGLLTWTPSEQGTVTITLSATSGGASATQSFAVLAVGGGKIDGGCGCAVGRTPQTGVGGILAALFALVAARRRRRG